MSRHAYIVDDDDAVRASLHSLLSSQGLEIRTFASGDDFLKALPDIAPGLVLLDVDMPGTSGIDVLRLLTNDHPSFGAVIVTGQGDIAMAVSAMRLGAMDFLEKPCDPEGLIGIVDHGFERLERESAIADQRREAKRRIAALSDREIEVLTRLIDGCSNKVIAHQLNISSRTVEVHRAHLMAKLNVRNLPEALRLAFAADILSEGMPQR